METSGYVSQLKEPIKRALSRWLASALMLKIVTYADLVRFLGVKELVTSISPEVRGMVFCACNGGGIPERASKVDAHSIAITISSMLRDQLVNEELVCQEISIDHMVEVLENSKLYALVFGEGETRPWKNGEDTSKKFVAAVHTALHEEAVLSPDDYVRLLENKLVHEQTPTELLVLGQLEATRLHRAGKTFSGADFIEVYAPDALVGYVALTDLQPAVEEVAKQHGWVADVTPIDKEAAPDAAEAQSESETGADSGIPVEALDSLPPPSNEEPEISISGSNSSPPVEAGDVEDDLDALELEVDGLEDDSRSHSDSNPPPLGNKRRREKKHAAERG